MSFMLKWVGINLYLVNRCSLIKYDQLKMLTAVNPSLSCWLCILPPLAEYQPLEYSPLPNCCSEENNEVEYYNDFEEF